MEKVIKIGKQEVRLNNNVAWTMEYRDQFGEDIVPAIMPLFASLIEGVSTVVAETGKAEITVADLAEAVQGRSLDVLLPMFQVEMVKIVINVTWAMAKAADENILPPKQWVKQFDDFPLDVVIPEVYGLALKGFVSSKNLKRLKSMKLSLRNLQPTNENPSSSTKSSSQDSKED